MSKGKRTSPTLQEVADMAGVSKGLASRVLNGVKTAIELSNTTRWKIERAALALDYKRRFSEPFTKPPEPESGLASRMGRPALGVVYQSPVFFQDGLMMCCVDGVAGAAGRGGFGVTFEYSQPGAERKNGIKMIKERSIDGAIIIPSGSCDSLSKYMADERMPHVVVAAGVPVTGDAVFCDDAVGAEKAMTHLRALGHVRICHVVGDRPHPGVARRGDAYRKNVVAAGHEPIMGPAPGESMRAFVTHCVARRKATAFLLCDDSYAVDFYMACHSMGLAIPDDISVVGFNDGASCVKLCPRLTTVRVPIWEMGIKAVDLLSRKLKADCRPVESCPFHEELVVRESCRSL